MIRITVLVVVLMALVGFIAFNVEASQPIPPSPLVVHAIPKKTDCYSDKTPAIGSVSLACDQNDSARVFWSDTSLPVTVYYNLTATFLVDHVAVWEGYASSGHIDVWSGSSWITMANYTIVGTFQNVTVTLGHQYVTSRLRDVITGGTTYVDRFEEWFYGDFPPVVIASKLSTASAVVMSWYSHHFTASGGNGGPYTWTLATNIAGLAVGSSNGTVYGKVTTYGTGYYNVTATDSGGLKDWDNVTFTSTDTKPTMAPSITHDWATKGVLYTYTFTASDTDVNQTLTWSFKTNSLGLLLGSSNHTVHGAPPNLGTWYVNVSVSDGFKSTWDNYTLSVIPPRPQPTGADWLAGIILLFIIAFFVLLGVLEHPVFMLFAGVAAFAMTIWVWTVTGDTIATFITGVFGTMLIIGALLIKSDRW